MIPVDQTVFGYPNGNCFAACVATLLEISISEVPDLGCCEGDWTRPLNRWLAGMGLGYVEVDMPKRPHRTRFYRLPDNLYVILSGDSPRGIKTPDGVVVGHGVIGRVDGGWDFKIAHDPHPSRDGIDGPVKSVAFILPLDAVCGKGNGR